MASKDTTGTSEDTSTPNTPSQDTPPTSQDTTKILSKVLFSKNQPPTLPSSLAHLLTTTPYTLQRFSFLQRTYRFSNFRSAMRFMALVAEECEKENHHPSWTNNYNVVEVIWTTHRPKGLSEKDVRMAVVCERVAGECGVVVERVVEGEE